MLSPDGANIVIWCRVYTSGNVEPILSSKSHSSTCCTFGFENLVNSQDYMVRLFFFLFLINLFSTLEAFASGQCKCGTSIL